MTYRLGMIAFAEDRLVVVETSAGTFRLDDLLGVQAPATIEAMLGDWPRWRAALEAAAARPPTAPPIDLAPARWLPPLAAPPKVICIGVNYRDHIAEMRVPDPPQFPYAFLRPATCLAGHEQAVALPAWPRMIDWEAELGVVIGRTARNLGATEALDAVAFYTVVNDLSARDWIESRPFVGVDWVMQKAWDDFQPTGPWLTPAAAVPDPQDLPIRLTVNGVVKQDSNTAQMVFGVAAIIEHLSRIMTLQPGDLIATGTPAGVGFGRSPREFLQPGDVVEVSVGALGTLRNKMAA